MRVDVVGGAVGGPAGVPDAGASTAAAGGRRAPCRGSPACRPASPRRSCPSCDQRDARRSRSRGTPAGADPRSRRPRPACGPTYPTIPHMAVSSTGGAAPSGRRACRDPRHDCRQRRRCTATASAERPGVAVRRARPRRLGGARRAPPSSRCSPRRSTGSAASATSSTSTRCSRSTCRCPGCSACTSRRRRPAPRPGGVPRPAAAAAHAVRDRPGRLGRGRQVDDRPGAAADARALARAPVGRAGHHRRLPLPQRRARAPRAAARARASRSPTTARRCCAS